MPINFARARSRYPHQPTMLDGYQFASHAEAARYRELRLLERARQISDLLVHPRFQLHTVNPAGEKVDVAIFTADFSFVDRGTLVVEDVKSPATAKDTAYRLRKAFFEAEYGIELTEIVR